MGKLYPINQNTNKRDDDQKEDKREDNREHDEEDDDKDDFAEGINDVGPVYAKYAESDLMKLINSNIKDFEDDSKRRK
jgi:hypothetical protein